MLPPPPPARLWSLIGLALALVVAGALTQRVGALGGAGASNPLSGRGIAGAHTLVVGNSVARAAVDPARLGAALGVKVADLAMQGSQPAHWLAALRHRVIGAGHTPRRVLVYAPLHQLTTVALQTDADRALLLTLLTGPDPDLIRRALGATAQPGLAQRALRGRDRIRRRALDAAGATFARFAFTSQERTAARAGLGVVPADPDARFAVVPGAPSPGQAAREPPPQRAPDQSLLPALLDETTGHGSSFVVVVPARSPDHPGDPRRRHAALLAWLAENGAEVVHLGEPPPAERFRTPYHPDPQGREQVTDALAEALSGSPPLSGSAVPASR